MAPNMHSLVMKQNWLNCMRSNGIAGRYFISFHFTRREPNLLYMLVCNFCTPWISRNPASDGFQGLKTTAKIPQVN